MSVCSKSFSVEKYQPNSLNKEGPKKTNSSDLLSFTISYRTTPKYYSGDHREKIKLFYQELDREGEGLDGAEMHEELERRRRTEIMRRILETFLIILVTVSSILCICLLCLLKFCWEIIQSELSNVSFINKYRCNNCCRMNNLEYFLNSMEYDVYCK